MAPNPSSHKGIVIAIYLGPKAGNGFNPDNEPSDAKCETFKINTAITYSKNTANTPNINKSSESIRNFSFIYFVLSHLILYLNFLKLSMY